MRLLSYFLNGHSCYGLVTSDGVINASARLSQIYPTLRNVLEAGALVDLEAIAVEPPDHSLNEIDFDLPLPDARKILCAGRNYPAYHEVQADGGPKFPSVFARLAHSFAPQGQSLQVPKECPSLDYECELVAVIGIGGSHIQQEHALSHVMGYTIMNEGTIRNWGKAGTQNFPGKNFDRCGSLGPWIVTRDEISDPALLHITTRRNGDIVQDGLTDQMFFNVPYLISHISGFLTLAPGDMIATGSPGGSIMGSDHPNWLGNGEEMAFEISGIGVLRNSVTVN